MFYKKPNHIRPTHSVKSKVSIIILSSVPSGTIKSYGIESLFKVYNKETLINYQLKLIHNRFRNQDYEIILVSGYQGGKLLSKIPDNIIKIENTEYNVTNTAGDLKIGLRACTGNKIIIFHGNMIFNKATLNLPMCESGIVIDDFNLDINKNTIGCIYNEKKYIENISYGLTENKWSGIIYICDDDLSAIRYVCEKNDIETHFTFEIINEIIDLGCKIKPLYIKDMKSLSIKSIRDLTRIGAIIC